MLFDVLVKTYKDLYNVKSIPTALRFRLNNINARRMDYNNFSYYFDLKNPIEALEFVLDDNNMMDIMRYANNPNKYHDYIHRK